MNNLIPADIGPSKFATKEALKTVTKVGDYLPRIQLMSSSSDIVKEGKFPMGHYALIKGKENYLDLTQEFICLILSWRPKAMQFQPDVISSYNPSSDLFKDIEERSKKPQSGCGYGPEFLLWLPEQVELVTYFMGNVTGRNEATNVMALCPSNGKNGVCVFGSHLIKSKKGTWHGPQVRPYNQEINLPDWALVKPEIEKFNNPSESEIEVAEQTGR